MKFWVDKSFTYTARSGTARIVDPRDLSPWGGPARVFDADEARFDLPLGWQPPVYGVRPLDDSARIAINNARAAAGVAGKQLPGVGLLLADEPIYSP